MEYIDDYGTCEETYATLFIYPGSTNPDVVTALLAVEPSRIHLAGEEVGNGHTRKRKNAWLLSSKGILTSRDCRRHIDWILDKLEGKLEELQSLQSKGIKSEISCFWSSAHGHGGPLISPHQMKRLAELNIEVWWDIYFKDADITPE